MDRAYAFPVRRTPVSATPQEYPAANPSRKPPTACEEAVRRMPKTESRPGHDTNVCSTRMRARIAVSTAIALATGSFCWFLMKHFHQGAADFGWAIHLVQRLVAHQNPYDTPFEQYPLTAALFAVPFFRLPGEVAAGIYWGLSSGLLAFGLTRQGYTRLLIFLAYPYWAGILTVQWSPLIAASAFFPWLLPATMAKPQVGVPVFFTRFNRRGFWACCGVAIASLIIMPDWPFLWWKQAGNYQHFFPIIVLPGPL